MDKINPVVIALATLNCTRSEFARRMGVHPNVAYMWQRRGAISLRHLKKACEVTGLPPHVLNPSVPAVMQEKHD